MGIYLLGVDGGGTQTTVSAVMRDGTIAWSGKGRGINFNIMGMEKARAHLVELVAAAQRHFDGREPERILIGMSALDCAADAQTVRAFAGDSLDADKIEMDSDVYMALMGTTLGGPGVMAVSGTGAMVVGVDEAGHIVSRAGWGYLLGDKGSSYYLATEGLKAAIDAWEGMGPRTALQVAALDFFHLAEPRDVIRALYNPLIEVNELAQFAIPVLKAAEAGDQPAYQIVHQNVRYLANQTIALHRLCPPDAPVGVYGGVFQLNPWVTRLFEEAVGQIRPRAKIGFPELPPAVGAVIPYMKRAGWLTEAALQRLRQLKKEEVIV